MAGLRLRASDDEDLCVLAAVLQDARVPINEMVFQPENARFMAALRRYRREMPGGENDVCLSVLRLDRVKAVRWRGLEPERPDDEHVVLTLLQERSGDVLLVFQGGEALRFVIEAVDARLEDVEPGAAAAGTAS